MTTVSSNLRFIEKNFTIGDKNVTDISEADVILLGETHSNLTHRVKNAALIFSLCADEDILLTEDNSEGSDFTDRLGLSGLTKRVIQKGWDAKERFQKDQVFEEKLKELLLIINELKIDSPLWIKNIVRVVQLYPEPIKLDEKELTNELATLSVKAREQLTGKILHDLAEEWYDYQPFSIYKNFVSRNESLKKCVIENCLTDHKVFVVAGSLHLFPNLLDKGGEFAKIDAVRAEVIKSVDILKEGLADKKFVFLMPNEKEDDIPELKEELKDASEFRQRVGSLSLKQKILFGVLIGIAGSVIIPAMGFQRLKSKISQALSLRERLKQLNHAQLIQLLVSQVEEMPNLAKLDPATSKLLDRLRVPVESDFKLFKKFCAHPNFYEKAS